MARKQTAFRLKEEIVEELKKLAEQDNRSLNNYVEVLLETHLEEQAKKKTESKND